MMRVQLPASTARDGNAPAATVSSTVSVTGLPARRALHIRRAERIAVHCGIVPRREA